MNDWKVSHLDFSINADDISILDNKTVHPYNQQQACPCQSSHMGSRIVWET